MLGRYSTNPNGTADVQGTLWTATKGRPARPRCGGLVQVLLRVVPLTAVLSPSYVDGQGAGPDRIDAVQSILCATDADGDGVADGVNQAAPLVGVAFKLLNFSGGSDISMAGMNLAGMGTETGQILVDTLGPPPPERPDNNGERSLNRK